MNDGRTPLRASCGAERAPRGRCGADIARATVDLANNDGRTPLLAAAQNGHHEVATALIAARANVDLANNDGRTPLLTAAQNGHHEVVTSLRAARATVDLPNRAGARRCSMRRRTGATRSRQR